MTAEGEGEGEGLEHTSDAMDRDSSSVSDGSSEAGGERGGGCCSSPSTRSLVDAAGGNLSRTVSDVSTSAFSEQCSSVSVDVDHSGPFEPTAAAVAKLIARSSPASAAESLRRLSIKPRADVLDRRSTDDGTYVNTQCSWHRAITVSRRVASLIDRPGMCAQSWSW